MASACSYAPTNTGEIDDATLRKANTALVVGIGLTTIAFSFAIAELM